MKCRLEQLLPTQNILSGTEHLKTEITGLTKSADQVRPGNAFFAVRGRNADGHRYLEVARRAGASVAIVEVPQRDFSGLPVIQVSSIRRLYSEACAAWFDHPSRSLRIFAVTGTNGKTTTSYLLYQMLAQRPERCGLVGTIAYFTGGAYRDSSLTTPDAWDLQQLFAEMKSARLAYCAIEASSIALEQHRLDGTSIEVAVFTNLTPDHLDYHGDMQAYLEAKRALFTRFSPRACVMNADDPASEDLLRNLDHRVIYYSAAGRKADFSATSVELSRDQTSVLVATPEGSRQVRLPLIGRHNLANALAAWASCYAVGMGVDEALHLLCNVRSAPGRLEPVGVGDHRPAVFVDYAHTEDALYQVLRCLRETVGDRPGRILTVFGCGGDRDKDKRPRMAKVVSEWSDVTIATSDNPRTEDPEAILDDVEAGISGTRTQYLREADRRSAIRLALSLAEPDDIVLIAGKGHETYQVLGLEKIPFDDRAIVRQFYA